MQQKSLSILTTLIVLLATGCDPKKDIPQMEPPAVPVIAVAAAVKDITVYVDSIGTLMPSVTAEIRPQIGGTISEVLVKEGQWVKQGTPLFKIEAKSYAIKVQEAEAQLAIDQASLIAAQKKLTRYRELADKDLVAQTEWDELEAQAVKAQGTVDLDQARVATAQLDLDHATILSPVEGRVGKLDIHPGMLVSASQSVPLATISKMDPLIVEFSVTEKEFPKIPKEEAVQIEMQPLCATEQCQGGKITFLDNHFDDKTGLLLIRGSVANPAHTLRPGQSVSVRVPVAVAMRSKLIPQKAVRYNQQGPYVYVVQADMTVALRQLVLGSEHGSDQIVIEGLEPAELVIVEGQLRLFPGIKVDIKS